MADRLHFINGELFVCETKMAVIDRLLANTTSAETETITYLRTRRSQWARYEAGLKLVRDDRPEPQTRGSHEV